LKNPTPATNKGGDDSRTGPFDGSQICEVNENDYTDIKADEDGPLIGSGAKDY